MKKLLIVSYCYPPVHAMGTVRIAAFARHLPKFGWKPYVLTIRPGPLIYDGEIPVDEDRGSVCRTPGIDLNKVVSRVLGRKVRGSGVTRSALAAGGRLSLGRLAVRLYDEVVAFPDSLWPWGVLAARRALEFARAVGPDAILSSSPPVTVHAIAARLRRELGVPWVAELRDLWSQSVWREESPRAQLRARSTELETFRDAAALCCVSEALAQELRGLHRKDCFVVTNGFEPGESPRADPGRGKLTVLFTGMIYPGKRDPRYLFSVLKELVDSGAVRRDELEFAFYGPNHDLTAARAREAGVADMVVCGGSVPRARALELQARAHLLLQLEWNDERAKSTVPGKFFEYLGSGRPILAVGPKGGFIEETLRRTGAGVTVSTPAEIKAYLVEALEAHRCGQDLARARDESAIALYTRENQTRVLAARLEALVGTR